MSKEYTITKKCKNCRVLTEVLIEKGMNKKSADKVSCPNCGCYLDGTEIPRVSENQTNQQVPKDNLSEYEKKFKFWAVAITVTIFGALAGWRIILKFIN